MPSLIAVDLFAGAGGLSLGLEEAGFRVPTAVEVNPDAAKTYALNHPNTAIITRDIRRIRGSEIHQQLDGELDLLAGGPPCQGFSFAGKRVVGDSRNLLAFQFLRIASEINPRNLLIENVPGLQSFNNGKLFSLLLRKIARMGYETSYQIFDASDFGVPQYRKRLFILGSRDELTLDTVKASNRNPVTVSDAIGDLAFLGIGESAEDYVNPPATYYQRLMRVGNKKLHNHETPVHSRVVKERFRMLSPGQKMNDLPAQYKTKKRDLIRLKADDRSPTITTLPEDIIHYRLNRILSVRELARLQSFPDRTVFLGPRTTGGPQRKTSAPQYTQVGNAVPPRLIKGVTSQVFKPSQ